MGIDASMFLKSKTKRRKTEVRDISVRLYDAFGKNILGVYRPNEFSKEGTHALEIIKEYVQDGPTIYPEADEQLIEVNLTTRFYDEGYERGDISGILSVAEWLEINMPDAQIFYGGDSSGVQAVLLDKKKRKKLFKHFALNGHLPYRGGFGDSKSKRYCNFCCVGMTQYGFGPEYEAYFCHGCGFKEETRDAGKTWNEKKD